MNLRYQILTTVAANPGATMDEIADAVDYDRKKVIYSVRDCTNKNGLLHRERDDVSGLPGYHLTDAGKKRLAQGPDNQAKANLIPKPKKAQPAVAQNTGSDRSEPSSATPSSEAVAVLEKPAPAAATPCTQPVAADVIPPPEYNPDDVAFSPTTGMNHGQRIAHVGGVVHDNGTVSFGSVMAVSAMLVQYIRDLPRDLGTGQPLSQQDADELQLWKNFGLTLGFPTPEGLIDALDKRIDTVVSERQNAQALAAKLQTLLDSKTHECEALRAQLIDPAPATPDTLPLRGYRVSSRASPVSVFSDEFEARNHAESLIIAGTVEQADVLEVRLAAKVVRAAHWQAAEEVA